MRLSSAEILPGSEIVMLEFRDRRNSGSHYFARDAGAIGLITTWIR